MAGEINYGIVNPAVLDYSELASFARDVYVCATCPLARSSMAKVVQALDGSLPKQAPLACQARAPPVRREGSHQGTPA